MITPLLGNEINTSGRLEKH